MAENQFNPVQRRPSHPPLVPDHQLLYPIGKGSYGEVWLARSTTGVLRAVKIVYRDSFEGERPYQREFEGLRYFEPLSRTHAGLVNILQVGRNDEQSYFYYVMELADGQRTDAQAPESSVTSPGSSSGAPTTSMVTSVIDEKGYQPLTLEGRIRQEGRLPLAECMEIALKLAEALHHLHEAGLVHRDIKPSNIIFVNGLPKLADIGLVAEAASGRSFVGTEGFVPPEGPGSVRADLYSLGKVIYEMAVGKDRLAFPSLPTDMDGISESRQLLEVNEIISKACHPEPAQRYSSARELIRDLKVLAQGESLVEHCRRQKRLQLLVGTGLVLSLIICGWLLWLHWVGTLPRGNAFRAPAVRSTNRTSSPGEVPVAGLPKEPTRGRDSLTNSLGAPMAERAYRSDSSNGLAGSYSNAAGMGARQREFLHQPSPFRSWVDVLSGNDPEVLERINLVRQALRQRPQLSIPEIQFLADGEWLAQSRGWKMFDLESEEGLRRALSLVRQHAKIGFAYRLGAAVSAYAEANGGQLPGDISQLKPHLDAQVRPRLATNAPPPMFDPGPLPPGSSGIAYPPIEDSTLRRYHMIRAGSIKDLRPGQPVIAENAPVDEQFDVLFHVGLKSAFWGGTGPSSGIGHFGPVDLESLTPQQREAYLGLNTGIKAPIKAIGRPASSPTPLSGTPQNYWGNRSNGLANPQNNAAGLKGRQGGLVYQPSTLGSTMGLSAKNDPEVMDRVNRLKQALKQRPQLSTPEIQYMDDQYWLFCARKVTEGDLESEDGLRYSFALVREQARSVFASRLEKAVSTYTKANSGQLPRNVSQLKPYLDSQVRVTGPYRMRPPVTTEPMPPWAHGEIYPPVDLATLQRYHMLRVGNVMDLRPGQPVITEKAPVDPEYDNLFQIGLWNHYWVDTRNSSRELRRSGRGPWDFESLPPEFREAEIKSRARSLERIVGLPVLTEDDYQKTDHSLRSQSPQPKECEKHWPFQWSEVESENWKQLMANMCAIGCPTQTVALFIRARITAHFQRKIDKLANPLAGSWSTLEEMEKAWEQRKALRAERDKAIMDVLSADASSKRADISTRILLSPSNEASVVSPMVLQSRTGTDGSDKPSLWTEIEGITYGKYVENLRSIHCPEETIRQIIRADLLAKSGRKATESGLERETEASFQSRASKTFEERMRESDNASTADQIDRFISNDLGLERPRLGSAWLAPEQEFKIQEIREIYPPLPWDPNKPETIAAAKSNYTARVQLLAEFLPAEDLAIYTLQYEDQLGRLLQLLRGLRLDKTEFLAVATAIEGKSLSMTNGHFIAETEAALKRALPPSRFQLLLDLQTPPYQELLRMSGALKVTPYELSQLITLRHDLYPKNPTAYRAEVTNLLKASADTFKRLLTLRDGPYPKDPANYQAEVIRLLNERCKIEDYFGNSTIHPNQGSVPAEPGASTL